MPHPVQRLADALVELDDLLAAIGDDDVELVVDALATASARITAQHRDAALRLLTRHLAHAPQVAALAVARDVEDAYAIIGWIDGAGAAHPIPLYDPHVPLNVGGHDWWMGAEALVSILEALDSSAHAMPANVLGHSCFLLHRPSVDA